jgi:hypothetical protein
MRAWDWCSGKVFRRQIDSISTEKFSGLGFVVFAGCEKGVDAGIRQHDDVVG